MHRHFFHTYSSYRGIIALSCVLIIGVMLATLVPFGPARETSAQTEQELQAQINAASNRIREIEARIAALGQNIAETAEERRTLEQELGRIERERQQLQNQIALTDSQIDKTNLVITDLSNNILTTEEQIKIQQDGLRRSIQLRQQYDDISLFEILLTRNNISEFWRDVDELLTIQEASQRHIYELRGLTFSLAEIIKEQEVKKEELESLKKDIEDQRKLVDNNRQEQAQLVRETRNQEEIYRQQLAAEERRRQAFEEEIRAYETQLKFLANPTALPPAGSAPLSWPLENILITQQFGARTGPHRTYTHGHSGVDFRAQTPQKLFSMAGGVVMGTGDTDLACRGVSFGRWITIRHDNNLVATYAHLSLINVQPGERVARGQLIGYTGNTGRTTAPHLHISLYAGVDANGNNPVEVSPAPSIACTGAILVQPRAPREAYLDPLDYLPATTRSMYKEGVFEQRSYR
ncbi:MAG: peptidoglycan DD-metalloendopeptidase family protein [Candidatus Pacebacteria bacterium]|nr:peptidoglycan DD-metalloendopeptidase family protein [Candidatus Paceibacterota bacterium]MCD8528346.1 peptidoglycan DD-metalloendopeptidase family protein [Candidatus Paceibacterota bacterium]MCD8563995.1 peptidoglycan DD-metalloendopeptidase family protein [Candidatus Paceibacterota bacterium]